MSFKSNYLFFKISSAVNLISNTDLIRFPPFTMENTVNFKCSAEK